MKNADVIKVVNYLIENKLHITTVYEPVGTMFYLKAPDVLKYIEDKDAFFAQECGVGKQDYLDWKAFLKAGGICSAVNKSGKRCTKKISDFEELTPSQYVKRLKKSTLKCAKHQK